MNKKHMDHDDMARIAALSAQITELLLSDRTATGMGDICAAMGLSLKCLVTLLNDSDGMADLALDDKKMVLQQLSIGLGMPVMTTELPEDAPHSVTLTATRKH